MDVVIYHNPDCGTSRNTLALVRHAGIEPQVVEYLQTPPSRETVAELAERIGVPLRDLIRQKGTPYAELGLDDPALNAEQLVEAIAAHPILLNRPIVVSAKGAKLCRPSDVVLDLLPAVPSGRFRKDDGAPFLKDAPVAPHDAGLRAALEAEGLPVDDLSDSAGRFFAYRTLDGERVGYAGFERHGADVLIRSVVVPPAARKGGIGRNLVPLLLFRAHEDGARRAFLLTTSATPFFGKLGFKEIDRGDAPPPILATRQAAALCPARASLMTRTIGF